MLTTAFCLRWYPPGLTTDDIPVGVDFLPQDTKFGLRGGQGFGDLVGPEQFERTLVEAGLVRDTSEYWDVAAEGYLINIQPC